MKDILLKPGFILKCIAWVFCFVVVVLLCSIPYWSVHEKGDYVVLPRKVYEYGELPEIEREEREVYVKKLNHVYHVIGATSATYLLVLSVFIITYLVNRPPKWQMLIMIFFGAALNIFAAIMEFVEYSKCSKSYGDVFEKYGYEDPDTLKPSNLLVLGMMLFFAGLAMLVDFVLYFVLRQNQAGSGE